jgi:glycerol kinase
VAYPAIVWQDRRTAERCHALNLSAEGERIRQRTGLTVDPYFSATKIEWLLRNVPGLAERAAHGDVLFGTVDAWLLWHLTGEHATDHTNASRTMLFDIDERRWDEDLLSLFGVPRPCLPRVAPSLSVFGRIDPKLVAGANVPVAGVLGDQQAALLGQGGTSPGATQVTWGTGAFLLMNVGTDRGSGSSQLLTTLALTGSDGRASYALEGSVFIAGAALQWLRDGIGLLEDAAESETLATAVDSTGGVVFVPALTGLGAPHWDPYARGAILGITRGTRREHLVRATLEAVAYQTHDVVRAMEDVSGLRLRELHVGGGAARNDFLCRFQSDILGVPVVRPQDLETTARGAALAAGIAIGLWDDSEDVQKIIGHGQRFQPSMSKTVRQRLLGDWNKAVERSRRWEERGESMPW